MTATAVRNLGEGRYQIVNAAGRVLHDNLTSFAFEETKHPRDKDGKFTEGHRVATKASQYIIKSVANNGYSTDPEGFTMAYNELSDEDKKTAFDEIKARGLTTIVARKPPDGRTLVDNMHRTARRMGEDHNDRTKPFKKSDQYHKAYHGTNIRRAIISHLSSLETPIRMGDLAYEIGAKMANVYGGEDPLKNTFNAAVIQMMQDGTIKVNSEGRGEPTLWINNT